MERPLPPRPDLSRAMMSVGFLLRPTQFLEECHARCGDFFTLRPQPGREVVFTVDPAAIRQVFTGDPSQLLAGEANVVLAPLLGPGSTLLLDGPEHLRHRRLLLPPFHGERMRAHTDTMREVAERHVAAWPRGRRFGVIGSMQAITLDVIMRIVFGVDDPVRRERLGGALRAVLDQIGSRGRVVALMLSAERLDGRLSPWRRFMAARAEAVALLREEIAAHRAADRTDGTDVLSLLLAARDEEGEPLSDDDLVDELMTLLVAGHETTATALSWTLERLVRHPLVLERAVAEEEGWLDAVITETLRLRPVVPAVVRKLTVPMQFGEWEVPAGLHIAPSIYLLHRRPDLYDDPLSFRPERFLGVKPGTYEWIPFGGGVRRCLGASFALLEMKVVLETILREVQLRPGRGAGESTTRRAITFAPSRGGRIAVA
jgi:cytochrome P450